jgi:hypothetical protein
MKTLLTLFVLLFSSSVFADDLSDLQIEGISIGDSLLDYFSEKEIQNNQEYYYKDNKMSTAAFNNIQFFKTFDLVQFNYKSNDKNYIINAIDGVISFEYNFEECSTKQNEIISDILVVFNDQITFQESHSNHGADVTGKSKVKHKFYQFESGDYLLLQCIDWSKKMEDEYNYYDHLKVALVTNELMDWLNNEAYK